MTYELRLNLLRWLLLAALCATLFCAARTALLIFSLVSNGGTSVFQPPSAEQVSRRAAPFQTDTVQTNGMFRIIQQQHSDLVLMFSSLESSSDLSWSLAVLGTATFSLLFCVLAVCLAILPRPPKPEQVGKR
jgi:hypothetical protein